MGGGLSDGILWLAGTNAGWGWDRALRRPDGCRQAVRTRPLYSKKLRTALLLVLVGIALASGLSHFHTDAERPMEDFERMTIYCGGNVADCPFPFSTHPRLYVKS